MRAPLHRRAAPRPLGTRDGVARFRVTTYPLTARPGTVRVGGKGALASRTASSPSRCAGGAARPAVTRTRPVRVRPSSSPTRRSPPASRHTGDDRVEAWFDEPASAVTQGRRPSSIAGDEVLGGGWIAAALDEARRKHPIEERARLRLPRPRPPRHCAHPSLVRRRRGATQQRELQSSSATPSSELAVSDLLMKHSPQHHEGEPLEAPRLARKCARPRREGRGPRPRRVAEARRRRGEVGGRSKESILAAAFEAALLIGAIYLDRGFVTARVILARQFCGRHPLAEPERRRGLQDAAPGDHPEALQGDADLHARHAETGAGSRQALRQSDLDRHAEPSAAAKGAARRARSRRSDGSV